MARKLTYEELEQKVKRLEREKRIYKESEGTIRALLNAPTEGAILLDLKGTILAINSIAAQRISKLRKGVDELIGQDIYKCLPSDVAIFRRKKMQQIVETGKPIQFTDKRSGKVLFSHMYPVFHTGKNLKAIAVFSIDMTDFLKTEEALRESEERYRNLVESSPDAIAVIQDNRYRLINTEFTELFGYILQDLDQDSNPMMIFGKQNRKIVKERIRKRLAGKNVSLKKWRSDLLCKDERLIPCEISATIIQYSGGPAILVIIRDITERKQAEEALRQNQEELEIRARDLQEVNTALRVLAKHRSVDKVELEKKVLSNIEQRVLPLLERIKNGKLDPRQKSFVSILESDVNDIVSSLSLRLYSRPVRLTPSEIQICNYITYGKTSREIAGLLCVSEKTIASHRRHIRHKLAIKNKKENLRSYLIALETDHDI